MYSTTCLLTSDIYVSRHNLRIASGSVSPVPPEPTMNDDSDDEEFVYPGASPSPTESPSPPSHSEVVTSPLSSAPSGLPSPSLSVPPAKKHPSPEQLEELHTASASGDLKRVQSVFKRAVEVGEVESFALANDASPRTGLTALHAAASRGYLSIVKWCM